MTYIVVFNVGYRDPEVMIDSHGFVEEFSTAVDARNEAIRWIDNQQYRTYTIYEQKTLGHDR